MDAKPTEIKPEVTIRRNAMLHRWMIVQGSHESQTPWMDTSDAVAVVSWIKTRAGGAVSVKVEL